MIIQEIRKYQSPDGDLASFIVCETTDELVVFSITEYDDGSVGAGLMTPNEGRGMLGMPRYDGAWGDQPYGRPPESEPETEPETEIAVETETDEGDESDDDDE